MGMIGNLIALLFGGDRNVIRETAEVFRENAESAAQRAAGQSDAALAQFAAEFAIERKGAFDRFIDGMNRVPRPALALGVIALFAAAMVDPVWFGERMAGLAQVPEPMWWLLGAVVSFYFGARHQAKGQEFQKSIAAVVARGTSGEGRTDPLPATGAQTPGAAATGSDSTGELAALTQDDNAAINDWREMR